MTQAARTACLFIIRQYTKKLYVVTNGYTIGIQKSESVMNGFFQAFRMEVLRAIQNSFFPTTYFAILITLFLNIYLYTTTDSYVSVAYLLEYCLHG